MPTELVERERELTELSDVLAQCARGSGAAVVLSGGIGCGKTELLDALKDRAVKSGFLVLGAVGSWAERRSPGSVLNQLLRYADVPIDDEFVTELLEQGSRTQAACDTAAEPERRTLDAATTAVLHQLCTEVLRIAERVPLLICVDDVQFIDDFSRHWMIQLLRHLRSARIALVVAECTLSRPVNPHLHAELLRLPTYRRLTVERLSRAGVAALFTQHLDAATSHRLAADAHAVSAGNPLLVRALAEDHRMSAGGWEGPSSQLVVGDAYGDAVLSCLHRGRPVLLRLAQALAVLDGDTGVPDLLVRLFEHEEAATIGRGVVALEAAGLLEGTRLRHRVARSTILQSLATHQRAAMHRRLAELLYADGAAATRVARHLLGAERNLPPWAVSVLREAAERHLVGNRAADAHACLEAALRVCADDPVRIVLKALLASAAWLLNPSISARHLGELATALREGRLPDRNALMLAKYLLWHGRFDEAADAIERIGDREDEADPLSTAEVRATRELLALSYPALVSSGARIAAGDPRGPRRGDLAHGDARIRATAALSYVLTHGPNDGAVADAEASMRAMRLGKRTQEWLMCAVAALEFADRLDAAASWCDHWLEEARAWHVPLWQAEFASLRSSISLRRGDPVRARELAESALTLVPPESWGVCLGGPLANLVQAATDTGDYEAAAAYLEMPVPDGMFLSRFGLYYMHARGRYHLAAGRPYAALDDFTGCGALMREWGFDQPALVPWRGDAAWAHLVLGDTHRAHVLAREQVEMAGEAPSRTRGVSLRVLAATSRPGERAGLLGEAVEILQACGDQLQLARALADLGRWHHESGRASRARPALAMAAQLAESCGADPLRRSLAEWGERATARVARVGATADPVTALGLLTDAERRVAALAARGHTNREISEELFITVSTVEQHLTRVFRKLGVKARRELPAEIVLAAA